MATYNVASGAATAITETLVASTADTVNFADRYNYVAITNEGTVAIFATTNGVAATTAGGGGVATIAPSETVVIANQLPYWDQSSKVIPAGAVAYPTGGGTFSTTTTPNGQPGSVQPYMSSLAGQASNPGTHISLISTGTPTYTVAAAG